jgi:HNH endonuclease
MMNKGHFKAGNVPWNKGKKGTTGWSTTRFKAGAVPPNHRPVGSERKCATDGYIYVKVAEGIGQYRLKQRVIWEQHHGPIPPSNMVVFLDNNRENFDIENLALVSRGELAVLNKHDKWTHATPDIKRALIGVVRLEQSAKRKAC